MLDKIKYIKLPWEVSQCGRLTIVQQLHSHSCIGDILFWLAEFALGMSKVIDLKKVITI